MKYLTILLLLFFFSECNIPQLHENNYIVRCIRDYNTYCVYYANNACTNREIMAECGIANVGDTLKICKK